MILVIGATGKLGRQTVQQALDAGLAVRAASRRPHELAHLTRLGVEVVGVDLVDADSVASACHGVDGVVAAAHSLLGTGAHRSSRVDGNGNRALIDAAARAGVGHLVFVSSVGASPTAPVVHLRTKYATEQHLLGSGMGYTILRPAAFMESHAHELIGRPLLRTGKVTIPGSGRNPINLVAATDVARYAVIALTDPRARGRVLEVAGWDNATKDQIARTYASAAGIEPTIRHVPRAALRAGAVALARVHPGIADVLRLLHWADSTDQRRDPSELQREFPFDMVRLDDFIRRDVASSARSRARGSLRRREPRTERRPR